MKKVLIGMCVAILMTGCGTTSEDINVADLNSACDCSDALIIIVKETLDEIGDKTEMDEKLAKTLEPKFEKLEELEDRCRRKLDVEMEEMITCNPELKELMNTFEAIY